MATVYLRDPSGFASPQRYLVPAMAAVLIVGAVEYLQRVFVFYPDQVRIRILWFWRTVKLPPRIDIGITARREVVLTEVANGRRVLRIPRDYTRSGKLAPELVTYYQGWQRFGDEVI